jgi:hypothetical protein
LVNCQEDNLGFGELDSPTALTVTAEIVGKSVAFPNGDGSGKVKFNSTAQTLFPINIF